MKGKSKVIVGFKKPFEFTLEERKAIIEEWLSSGKTKREVWKKYTGMDHEHGYILNWMRYLGYEIIPKYTRLTHVKIDSMAKSNSIKSLEVIQMEEKIKELEKALVNSELRATALDTMIDIAEKELKINIRKKSSTKQSIK